MSHRRRRIARTELAVAIVRSGLSSAEVAQRADLDPSSLSNIVRGAVVNPRPETKQALADVLGYDVSELFEDDDAAVPA